MPQSLPNMLKAYQWLTRAVSPIVPLYLSRRARKGKEDKARLSERYGKTELKRPDGDLIWLHAASVGESVMLLPLIEHILKKRSGSRVLITTGTVTSAQVMAQRLPKGAIHQYAPIDTPRAVSRFLDHWMPSVGLWAESEIWPNLILQCRENDVPMALINARMSAQSLARWSGKYIDAGKALFGAFDVILPADSDTAKGLSALYGKDLPLIRNLKYAGKPLGVDVSVLAAHRAVTSGRPIWCAASTHEGEDEIVLAAHREILKMQPDALLFLVPRHPQRGPRLIRLLEQSNFDYVQSGYAEDISELTNVILIAAMGQLGLAYRLASVSLVGGSLLPALSGHNPLEPARLGSAILSGPYRASFEEIYDAFEDVSAVQTVGSAGELAAKVLELLATPTISKAQVEAALAFTKEQDTVLDAVWKRIEPLLKSL